MVSSSDPRFPLPLPSFDRGDLDFRVASDGSVKSPMDVVAHGDETRGGSGSKVNMEAIVSHGRPKVLMDVGCARIKCNDRGSSGLLR